MNLIETYNGSGLYAQYATSADYASNGQPLSAALTAVPDTYLQNTDLTITDGKVTEISGVPLSAGDELPSGVMNTSALEYNAVNEISGYNGSAIAQYGAEKQWLVHDDTLVHAANSAQYALGVNLSAVAQLLGVDETVLYSGDAAVSNCTITEPITHFNSVKFLLYGLEDSDRTRMWFECDTSNDTWNIQYSDGTNYAYTQLIQLSSTDTTLSAIRYKEINYGPYNSTAGSILQATGAYPATIKAVIGIGRKQ